MADHHAGVEEMEIDSDEAGWYLKLTDTDGVLHEFRFHHLAFDFAGSEGLRSLLEWRGEGESIRAEVRAARQQGLSMWCSEGKHHACVMTPYERCDCACHILSLTDSKNPIYHEALSRLADE